MVLSSPVSVQLDEDDRTMIQPDVVICFAIERRYFKAMSTEHRIW